MGDSITEGTIVKWHKAVGDQVEMDEILCEVETDKVRHTPTHAAPCVRSVPSRTRVFYHCEL